MRRGTRRAALVAACWLLELAFLRFAWIAAQPAPGQWALAYFGRCGAGSGLVLGRGVSDANPPIDVDRDGRVGLAPGQSLALPLPPGASYVVEATRLPPYAVLLADMNGAPPLPPHDDGGARCVADARVAVVADAQPRWSPWQAAAPWRDDAARLRATAAACGAGASPSLRVRREADAVVLALGDCRWRHPLAAGAQLGVVAGPDVVRVTRDGGWTIQRRVRPLALLVAMALAALHAVLLAGALRGGAPFLLAAFVAFTLVAPQPGGLRLLPALALWTLAGAGAAFWLSWRRTRTRRPRMLILAAHAVVAAALLAAPLGLPALARAAIGGPAVVTASAAPPRCLLTGYSTAAGSDLVPRGADAFAELDAECAPCAGAILRHALPGRIFEDVRRLLRRSDGARGAGVVLFWGGGNDDVFWSLLARGHLAGALRLDAYVLEALLRSVGSGARAHPTTRELRAALAAAEEASLADVAEQTRAIRDAVEAVAGRGARFVYAHDFLAYDLDGGRSPTRRALVAARREAVLASGGGFIDLLDEVGDRAGVSWFDDFIHPSAWGQQQLAAPLCRALSR